MIDAAREAIERHARRNDLSVDLWLATMVRLERQLALVIEIENRGGV